jgi:hypothetical protein
VANRRAAAGGDSSHQSAATPHAEPPVPEVFKMQKAGKAKVEEGQSEEGIDKSDKPFVSVAISPAMGNYIALPSYCVKFAGTPNISLEGTPY